MGEKFIMSTAPLPQPDDFVLALSRMPFLFIRTKMNNVLYKMELFTVQASQLKMNRVTQWLNIQPHPLVLYLLLFILFLSLVVWFHKSETRLCRLPPSPSTLPIIGNLHQVRGLPHHALQALAQKHGPLMWLRLGCVPTLVVSSADGAREVLKTFDHVISSRANVDIPKRLIYGKDIAFAPYGEYWRQLRKVCVLQLLSAKKVQSFRFVREEEVVLMLEKMEEASLTRSSVNMSEIFMLLTYDISCRASLGRKYSEGEVGRKFKDTIKELTCLLGVANVRDLIPSLGWVNYVNGLNKRVESTFKELDSFLDKVIEEHLEKETRCSYDDGDKEEEDFVDVMLAVEKDSTLGIPLTRDSTKAVILDMFAAGSDTSAVALEWAMCELIRNPEVMKEVQQEVRDIASGKLILHETDTEKMHYLRSVIKETLRLHPAVPLLVPRESMENVKIQGYDIPANTTVIINAFAIARDLKLWEEPERFWPRRFMTGGTNASVDFRGQDFQFIPFGGGRRGCPGILFATSIIELALANLLNRFDWALPNGMDGKDLDMHERSGITVHRKNELFLSVMSHYH